MIVKNINDTKPNLHVKSHCRKVLTGDLVNTLAFVASTARHTSMRTVKNS